jgi:hypothetical protein
LIDLTPPRLARYREKAMRILLVTLAAAGLLGSLGCVKRVPAPKPPPPPPPLKLQHVRQLGTPSSLIDPPPEPSVTDKMPFDLPLNKGYEIEGSWSGPAWDTITHAFVREGHFTVKKGDASEVDPAEIDSALDRWVSSSGAQRTQSERLGTYGRTTGYGTPKTVGTVQITVLPESPAKSVNFTLRIFEKPRSSP